MTLTIYRNAVAQATIEIDENTVFVQKLMGEHKIVAETIAAAPLPIQIGDYIEWGAEKFYINTAPGMQKVNNFTYQYNIVFEGEIYYLFNKLFIDEGVADFSYHGSPEDFLLLLLTNMNSTSSGWAIAEVDELPSQTLTFNGDTCRTALTKIAEAFQLEYRLVNRNIYLQKSVGNQTTLQFEYGRDRGLYQMQLNAIEDKNLVTRVYGFGAQKNIDYNYRGGLSRLVFEDRILEKNILLYGEREGQYKNDDIFPNRTGTVTDINVDDRTHFYDSALDFDINNFLLEGTVAKVVFKTGALAGYEFEISRYLNSSKLIDIIPFTENNGYVLPNAVNFPEVGDEYTLVDIKMPQVYIDAAEAKLQEQTQKYLDENSVPRVAYTLNIDEKYVQDRGIDLRCGDIVKVLDADLGINSDIRVSDISYPLVNPDKVTATISNTIPYDRQERLIAQSVNNSTVIVNVDRRRAEEARRTAARFRQLQSLVADPDGYFDASNIKPGSIATLMLSVGARSQNFGLLGVTLEANAGGDVNALKISTGQLVHYEIEIPGLGYVWDMDPRTFTGLDPLKHYFVYAKCSTSSLHGTWEVNEDFQQTEAEVGYYLFNLGILYAVKDGRRDFDFTNGMTYINGDTITTGTIKSLDGYNFFSLSEGKFMIGDEDSSLDWNVTKPDALTIKGLIEADGAIFKGAQIENLTVRSLKTRDTGRRLEILESGNNLVIYDELGREVARIDDDIDSDNSGTPIGGIRTTNPVNGRVGYVTGNGVFSNAGNTQVFSAASGRQTKGSLVGLLFNAGTDKNGAVVGANLSGSLNAYGGYFFGGLRIEGGAGLVMDGAVNFGVRRITTSITCDSKDHLISCYNTSNITIRLPAGPGPGRTIEIRRNNLAQVLVNGNGKLILDDVPVSQNAVGYDRGHTAEYKFDGQYWMYCRKLR